MAGIFILKKGGEWALGKLFSIFTTDCHDEYKITIGMRGVDATPGHTFIKLVSPVKLVVNDKEPHEGYPTVITIAFNPGSRIRDMYFARYGNDDSINVKDFYDWFKHILKQKIEYEGAEIEIVSEVSDFVKHEIPTYGPPFTACLTNCKKKEWTVYAKNY